MNKKYGGSHAALCSYYSTEVGYYFLTLFAWFLICQTIFSPKEALSLKYACKCEIQLQGSSTQKCPTRGSQQTDREWLIAFFLGGNPIHAKQKPYFVSIMVWLYYCAFHEIHLKGGVSLAHSPRCKKKKKKILPAAVLWIRTTLAILPGNNRQDACEP